MFSYWVKNKTNENLPPKIGFMTVPRRQILAEREIINGIDIKQEWNADGSKLIAL